MHNLQDELFGNEFELRRCRGVNARLNRKNHNCPGIPPKASEGQPSISCTHRSCDALPSLEVSSLACVLLAASLFLAIDHAALNEQELNNYGHPVLTASNVDAYRPIGMCAPTSSAANGHHGGNCPLNFILSLSQEGLLQVQGSSSVVQLSITLVSGVSLPVTLTGQGMPAGTQIHFAPASARPSFSSTMTIVTSAETSPGQFNITIFAAGGGLVRSALLSLMVVPIVHNIALVSAMVQGAATIGSIVSINAAVANYGSVSEAFELRAYANTSLVAELSGLRLASSAIYTGRLMWNTTGFSAGTYTVLVTVTPIQNELNLLSNSREAGKILLAQNPGSGPSPSPASSGGGQGFNYGRQLAILAAIAEVAIVFLVVLRKGQGPTGDTSRKILEERIRSSRKGLRVSEEHRLFPESPPSSQTEDQPPP